MELAHKLILLAQAVFHCFQGKSNELELILRVAPARRELGDDVLKWLVDALGQIQAGCAAQRHEYHGGYDDDEGELVVRRLRHIGHHEHERLASVGGLVEILAVGLAVMRDTDNVALFGGVHDDVYVDGVLVGIRAQSDSRPVLVDEVHLGNVSDGFEDVDVGDLGHVIEGDDGCTVGIRQDGNAPGRPVSSG